MKPQHDAAKRRKAEPKYRVNRVGDPVPVTASGAPRSSSKARAEFKAARLARRAAARQAQNDLIDQLAAGIGAPTQETST